MRRRVAAALAAATLLTGGLVAAAPAVFTGAADVRGPAAMACRLGPPDEVCGSNPVQTPLPGSDPDLPGCPGDAERAAVVDKEAQRFWLCEHGRPSTEQLPMTSGSKAYGLPQVGTYRVFARNVVATGIHGERLNRFVVFYRTSRGNRIGFHEYVNQPESTVGDLAWRGDSSGCLRVTTADSWLVWNFLRIGDPVVVITP